MNNQSYIEQFALALSPLLGSSLPQELVGDLDDLLSTSEELCALLREIAQGGAHLSTEQLKSKLYHVQILVDHDLRMVAEDVLPPLRTLFGDTLG
jgi:hypothetical protein